MEGEPGVSAVRSAEETGPGVFTRVGVGTSAAAATRRVQRVAMVSAFLTERPEGRPAYRLRTGWCANPTASVSCALVVCNMPLLC